MGVLCVVGVGGRKTKGEGRGKVRVGVDLRWIMYANSSAS